MTEQNLIQRHCGNCGAKLKWVKWEEPQGDEVDDESYWECPNGCSFPTLDDGELSREDWKIRLAERRGV